MRQNHDEKLEATIGQDIAKEHYELTNKMNDYCCPQCHAHWTQFEVLDRVGTMGLECHHCGGLLEREGRRERDLVKPERQGKIKSHLNDLVDRGFISRPKAAEKEKCPLCLTIPGMSRRNFAKHVGQHMEEIALSALPHGEVDDSDVESTGTNLVSLNQEVQLRSGDDSASASSHNSQTLHPSTVITSQKCGSRAAQGVSLWASEDRIGQGELLDALEKVLSELKEQTEHSKYFLKPVNRKDALDYYSSKSCAL